jgi:hypothetical protein
VLVCLPVLALHVLVSSRPTAYCIVLRHTVSTSALWFGWFDQPGLLFPQPTALQALNARPLAVRIELCWHLAGLAATAACEACVLLAAACAAVCLQRLLLQQ